MSIFWPPLKNRMPKNLHLPIMGTQSLNLRFLKTLCVARIKQSFVLSVTSRGGNEEHLKGN